MFEILSSKKFENQTLQLNPNNAGLFPFIFEDSSYLRNDLRNFNEIFSKNVTYDNIKIKKTGFHPLMSGQIDPPPSHFRLKLMNSRNFERNYLYKETF